ncbi:MAG TPA: vWA domain-containing protein, partial [Herpetosiphonaceae bacterium]|nr:vWA domain-containing protein [Herpetosiphonaceae bacterium]
VPLLNGNIEVGDWLPTDSGGSGGNDVKAALDEHIASKDFLIIPVYNLTNGNGNSPGSGYRIDRFVKVRLLDYNLGGSNAYFEFALLEDNVFCVSQEPNLPPPPPGAYSFKITVSESLVYTTPGTPGTNYDIAIVADYSASMKNCWDTASSCPPGTRRIDYAAEVLRNFVHEMLVVRNSEANGGDNRLAYVTFGQKATKVVPFGTTEDTLAKFKAAIGDKANPITLPNSAVSGNTNIADGISGGVSYLSTQRIDKYGKPVKMAVLILSDGLTNTFNDGPATWTTNRHNNAPYYCGDSDLDMENPLVQSTCPKQEDYPNQNISTPPVEMMVKADSDASASKGIEFFAVVMGEQFGLTPVKMHLNRITNNYFMANSPAQLAGLVNAIAIELGEPCQELSGGVRLAVGAQVTISFATGGTIGTYTTNAEGQIVLQNKLAPGNYILKASHSGVVAPQDKLNIPRTYNRILLEGDSTPVTSVPFVMPSKDFVGPDITLVIDNDANAKCN